MPGIDLASRVHDHNYAIDPYVRSLLDTDFYKLLMAAYVQKWHPDVHVTFTMKIRSKGVRLADIIREEDLRAQLDHVRALRFTNTELIWLAGASFYGQVGIFSPEFIAKMRDFRLPDYSLTRDDSGEFQLSFTGRWGEVKFWEIYGLAIVNEARARAGMRDMSKYQLRVLYANATSKLVGKLKALRDAGVPRISEFGTRRRHGFLWQEFAIEAMGEELGGNFAGTSNALQAMRLGIEAVGTNAHELPMVASGLARIRAMNGDGTLTENIFRSQYEVLERWQQTFRGNLLVALPDTFGTTQFLKNARQQFPAIADWRGFRLDSKDPGIGAEEIIRFWQGIGEDPKAKLMLFSDGLDVDGMIDLHARFGDRCLDAYGWGTLATNDFRGCDPRGGTALDPISVVCKVTQVMTRDGAVSAVKLSDNFEKATGEPNAIALYRDIFGTEGVANIPVQV